MKKAFILFFAILLSLSLNSVSAQSLPQKLDALFQHQSKTVWVAAHRGDWRQAPENSMFALLNCIQKGFDIMELDVKMTKDSQLVVMHDNTIDRTTNGKGKVSDFTLEEIRQFRLKNGLGRVTLSPIPTFKEMMLAAKGKILINVDKGNDHLPEVFKVLKETGTLNQAIVNIGDNLAFAQMASQLPANAAIMVVVNMARPDAMDLIKSYNTYKRSVIQPVFNTDSLQVLHQLPLIAKKQVVWLNSLWPSLNGGHDDDLAVEQGQKEESWGWLLKKQPAIIQSDRPADLLIYLKEKHLH